MDSIEKKKNIIAVLGHAINEWGGEIDDMAMLVRHHNGTYSIADEEDVDDADEIVAPVMNLVKFSVDGFLMPDTDAIDELLETAKE